jgi:hypothetical protein
VNYDSCKDGGSSTPAKGALRPFKKIGFSKGSLPQFFCPALGLGVPGSPRSLKHNQISNLKQLKVMSQFEKTYIGKGTQVKDLDIIRVSISKETLEEILKDHMVDYDGKEYLVFEVASLKEPDQYGKTHTAYISKKVAAQKSGKSRKTKA